MENMNRFCFVTTNLRLKAIIAHSTVLGPSLGGTRIWNYQNDQEALVDAPIVKRDDIQNSHLG